ncbi:MAG TPA: glycosyltransferase, partial [Allocoleopsis sp.]
RYTFEPKAGNNAARNRGIAVAKGEIIALTDADCIPHPDWLSAGVQALQMHPLAGIVGGQIEFFFEGDRPTTVEYADSICYLQQPVYVSRDHYAAGANLFTLRGVIETVGGFEERLLNLGDKEFGQRVYEAGWQVMYCPEAIVYHPARTTLQQLLEKTRRQTRANRVLCQLTGQPMPKCNFLPMGWQFFRAVWKDENLPGWGEKLALIGVMHRLKWVVAWERVKYGN